MSVIQSGAQRLAKNSRFQGADKEGVWIDYYTKLYSFTNSLVIFQVVECFDQLSKYLNQISTNNKYKYIEN